MNSPIFSIIPIVDAAEPDDLKKALGVAGTHPIGGLTRRRELEEWMNPLLERVLERVRGLREGRQWEVAEVLLASLDQQSPDFHLSPRAIARAERDAANHGRFATDEEVREVFARMTDMGSRRIFTWLDR
jgi:hypothetical protein